MLLATAALGLAASDRHATGGSLTARDSSDSEIRHASQDKVSQLKARDFKIRGSILGQKRDGCNAVSRNSQCRLGFSIYPRVHWLMSSSRTIAPVPSQALPMAQSLIQHTSPTARPSSRSLSLQLCPPVPSL